MPLTPEQLAVRRTGITGTDAPALVGEHPWRSPIDVYASKKDPTWAPPEENEDMRRGRLFEEPTARWWAELRGASLESPGTLVSKRNPLVIATPDFLATTPHGRLDLSIKVPRRAEGWGPSGTDEAPAYALLQAQWELLLLSEVGITEAEIAAPLYGELRTYVVRADLELQSMLQEAAERFWKDYILTGTPPPPDYSESYAEWLKHRHPADTQPLLQATPEQSALAWQYKVAKTKREMAEKVEAEARNALVAAIGDAAGLQGHDWRITYKATKGRATTDWKAVCAEARVSSELIDRHTKRNPFRVLRATFPGEAEE